MVSALLCPPIAYDVHSLNKAFEDQDNDTIVTIIVSSKSITFLDTVERYHTGKRGGNICVYSFRINRKFMTRSNIYANERPTDKVDGVKRMKVERDQV